MKPIYEPKGKAKEYGDYALNIYTGCPHECFYCFAPNVLHREREKFHTCVVPRENIVEETRKQIERDGITGKLIHLCFTCDPYPCGYDTTPTREIIKIIKESGNNVQILTKGDGRRDFDLLDRNDWYGITLDGIKCKAPIRERLESLAVAHSRGIKTWVSLEPVTDERMFFINLHCVSVFADKVKIGKLNYHPSDIDWKTFGEKAEALCKSMGIDYYIKDGLREEMNNRPLNKDNPKNIKCEHCKHFAESSETRRGFPIMKCKCQDSKWHNEERRYWNRCKCFEWHERYDHPTEKGGVTDTNVGSKEKGGGEG